MTSVTLSSPSSATGFSASFVRVVADYVQAQGHDAAPILDLLGLSPTPSADDQLRVPSWRLNQALQRASQLLGDEHIGLHVASLVRPAHLGSLGYAIMSCTLGGDGLALFEQMQSLLCTELRGRYEVQGSHVQARHEALGPLPDDYLFWSFFIASRLSFARWVSGRHLVPALIELPCAAPAQVQPLLDFIGSPVHFHAKVCQERMPADWLGLLNPNADPPIHDLMTGLAKRQLQAHVEDAQAQQAQLTQAILRALDGGESPSLELIAAALATPPRHVQRRLAAQGLTFKGLVEDARRERALLQLRLSNLPL
ncbi:MAG: AraC family transcriptional regulator ligand-binding domain-containing protein, partial [Pseudomonadota bacterium]